MLAVQQLQNDWSDVAVEMMKFKEQRKSRELL
jgi:hypothetical protein